MEDHHAPDPSGMRRSYLRGGLLEADLAPTWWEQFATWFEESVAAQEISEPNAMVLSTVTDGAPTSRTVLLKGFDPSGFTFFTNRDSRKGRSIAAEPRVSLLFPWHQLERQVVVLGTASPVPDADSDAYFASRPRGSQLGAWASPQSSVVSGRVELEAALAEVEERYAGVGVPRPPHWGGYLVSPASVEFWQGRPDRLHDRLRYVGDRVERLGP